MWQSINYFIMIPMVYIAFAVFIGGLVFKIALAFSSKRIKGTLGIYPQTGNKLAGILKDSLFFPMIYDKERIFWLMLIFFHCAFLFLFLGHLELVSEINLLQIIPHDIFLGSGAVGIIMMITTLFFLFRRFHTPYREISVPEDYILLIILFFCILFGSILHLSSQYGSYSGLVAIAVEDYREYLYGMLTLNPELPYRLSLAPHFVILALHVLFANIFLMLFPFSKMIHSVFTFFAHGLKWERAWK